MQTNYHSRVLHRCYGFHQRLHVGWHVVINRPHRSSAYVDAAHCYRASSVGLSLCLSVTLVSSAKTAEPVEMPFGLRTRVSPRNHVLDGVQISLRKGQF